MLILRIKKAEVALADGRLDEAFDVAAAEDVRAHRSGQDLAGKVARALVKRGREHMDAGRLLQAGSDCEKAARLGGNLPEVAELRTAITAALQSRQAAEKRRGEALAAARHQMEQGQLTICQKLLDGVEEEPAQGLMAEVAARRAMVETMVEKINAALNRDDWEAALEQLVEARRLKSADTRLHELGATLAGMLIDRVRSAMAKGRLDLASSLMARLGAIGEQSMEVEQLQRALEQCRQVCRCIDRGDIRGAEEIVRRLGTVIPAADWIESVLRQLKQATESMQQLRSGPFGLLRDCMGQIEEELDQTRVMGHDGPGRPHPGPLTAGEGAMRQKLMIQVDGIGSFLLVRGSRVTLGPLSREGCDLGLLTEPSAPIVTIERIEDDYFLRSVQSVTVNDRSTTNRLLASGDRIALASRCKLAFRVPSGASSTAVLDLLNARLPRGDVRHVILADREVIIGPGPGSHIRCDEMDVPAVLVWRDENLVCQGKAPVRIDGRPARQAAIPLGAQVEIGPVSFVVTAA